MPNAAELQTDMPNYTNIVPQIQFNDILIESNAALSLLTERS
jgi:hypothetical protein